MPLILALFPGYAANGSVINNDALAGLLAVLLWLPLLARNEKRRGEWWAGAVFGAACLAKLSVLALGPVLFLGPLARRHGDLRRATRYGLGAGAVALVVMLPWTVRNYLVYGNPLAIGVSSLPHPAPDVVAAVLDARPGQAFVQFWGSFGIFNNLYWRMVPVLLVPFAALGLSGWLRAGGGAPDPYRGAAAAFGAALVLAGAGLTYFSVRYYGAWQGRYLYPALPFAALVAGGWERWLPKRWRWWLVAGFGAVLLALDVTLVLKLHRFFSVGPAWRWGLAAQL